MTGQSRMEGDTGGIFSSLPSQLWLLPWGRESPRKLDTSCWICLPLPLAKKVWVWYSAALGTTTRDEAFSTSAKIWMDSPWRGDKRGRSVRAGGADQQDGEELILVMKDQKESVCPTWSVAFSLYLGAERDWAWNAEPAAQGLLLGTTLWGLIGGNSWLITPFNSHHNKLKMS